ncbi:unnamed protein product [Clavelina lepadiformis]|uniref:DUF2428 domain-containing protein n=1 Tax=Clavelina lepadiformis TaxID=159417 RepID=A0ABP0GWE2_CLALP
MMNICNMNMNETATEILQLFRMLTSQENPALSKLHDTIMYNKFSKDVSVAFSQLLFSCPKVDGALNKKFFKLLKHWSKFDTSFPKCLCEEVQSVINSCEILSANHLFWISCVLGSLNISEMLLLDCIPSLIVKVAHSTMGKDVERKADSRYQFLWSKLVMQILHGHKKRVCVLLGKKCVLAGLKTIAVACISTIINGKDLSPDLLQMCGSIIGCMLSYFQDLNKGADTFLCLIQQEESLHEIEIMPNVCVSLQSYAKSSGDFSLWFIKGSLSCWPAITHVFCDEIWNSSCLSTTTLLNETFAQIVCYCQSCDYWKYHALQTLALWWKKCLETLSISQPKNAIELFNEKNELISSSIQIVCDNWDSTISGATDILMQILDDVSNVNKLVTESDRLIISLFDHLLNTSDFVKGKYRPLALLISKFGARFMFDVEPNFLQCLIPVLGINHLAPAVSKVFKATMESLFPQKASVFNEILWKEKIGSVVVASLLSETPSVRRNSMQYWIPVVINTKKEVFLLLTELLATTVEANCDTTARTCPMYIASMIGVYKAARSGGIINFHDINPGVLKSGLMSYDNCIRADAFHVICKTRKKSEPLVSLEFDILRKHIGSNLNSDSASFRLDFIFSISVLLSRIQLSIISSVKQNLEDSYVKECVDFILYLKDIILKSIHLTCSYQRKRTALDIYEALAIHFTQKSASKHKYSITKEDFELLSMVLDQHHVQLLCEKLMVNAVNLFEDLVPDIRDSAFKILLHFNKPDARCAITEHLKQHYFDLLNSSKVPDTEYGVAMLEFLIKCKLSSPSNTGFQYIRNEQYDEMMLLFHEIAENLQKNFSCYQKNILEASYCYPPFGWISAMSKFLSTVATEWKDREFTNSSLKRKFFNLLLPVIKTATAIVEFLLDKIFSCKKKSGDGKMLLVASADFREISCRVYEIIHHCKPDDTLDNCSTDDLMYALYTEDYENVMSCSWMTLKNSCALLSQICCFLLNCKAMKTAGIPNEHVTLLKEIFYVFPKILTMCRHMGVVESCCSSLSDASLALFCSANELCCEIPIECLKSVLKGIEENNMCEVDISQGTVTRRSAGLPLIVNGILCACVTSAKCCTELINMTIKSLLSILNAEEIRHAACNTDLPEVHVLYILKGIFESNVLGPHVLEHLTSVFIRAITYLRSSSLWAIRNASIHLLSAISSRMLGQKHIEDKSGTSPMNSLTAAEFFARFPELFDFLNHCLEEALDQDHNKNSIQIFDMHMLSSLYPCMALISHLTYEQNSEFIKSQNDFIKICNFLKKMVNCHSFALRSIVIRSVFGWFSTIEIVNMVFNFMSDIPSDDSFKPENPGRSICQNELHGWMSLALKLLQHSGNTDYGHVATLSNLLLSRSWLGCLKFNPCPLTASSYIGLLQLLYEMGFVEIKDLKIATNQIWLFVQSNQYDNYIGQVGFPHYIEKSLYLLLCISSDETLPAVLEACLNFGEVRSSITAHRTCLTWLINNRKSNKINSSVCVSTLCQLWDTQGAADDILEKKCLELIADASICLFSKCGDTLKSYRIICNHIVNICEAPDANLSQACYGLKALSVVVCQGIEKEPTSLQTKFDYKVALKKQLCLWALKIQNYTWKKNASEPLRQASSDSIKIAGGQIVKWISKKLTKPKNIKYWTLDELLEIASAMCNTTLYHLYDELADVRHSACTFVALLQPDVSIIFQQNIATEQLLLFFVNDFKPHLNMLATLKNHFTDLMFPSVDGPKSLFVEEDFNLHVEQGYVATLIKPFIEEYISTCTPSNEAQVWVKEDLRCTFYRLHRVFTCLDNLTWKKLYKFAICNLHWTDLLIRFISRLRCNDAMMELLHEIRNVTFKLKEVHAFYFTKKLLQMDNVLYLVLVKI